VEIEDDRQAKSAETGGWLRIGRGSAVAGDIFTVGWLNGEGVWIILRGLS
jgi:hypothetical protein